MSFVSEQLQLLPGRRKRRPASSCKARNAPVGRVSEGSSSPQLWGTRQFVRLTAAEETGLDRGTRYLGAVRESARRQGTRLT